jgi:acyl-CoA-dependent ceramide synthase
VVGVSNADVSQTSKTLNYLDSIIVGPYYLTFMGIWIYLRHWINWRILWATLTEFRTVGPFELNWETQQYKCWISQYITFSLLACLQAVNLFWLFLILRIAKNYVFSNVTVDERSEDEEEDENTDTPAKGEKKALEGAKVNGNRPVVLVNGEPVEGETRPGGVRERKRKG